MASIRCGAAGKWCSGVVHLGSSDAASLGANLLPAQGFADYERALACWSGSTRPTPSLANGLMPTPAIADAR